MYWVHEHPQGGEKIRGPKLHGKLVSAHVQIRCECYFYFVATCKRPSGLLLLNKLIQKSSVALHAITLARTLARG